MVTTHRMSRKVLPISSSYQGPINIEVLLYLMSMCGLLLKKKIVKEDTERIRPKRGNYAVISTDKKTT